MRYIVLSACIIATLGGCARVSESRLNPLNWFGGDDSETTTAAPLDPASIPPLVPDTRQDLQIVDHRNVIDVVTDVAVQNVTGGLLITATGRSNQMGAYNADLVPVITDDNASVVLEFRVQVPMNAAATAQSITVARFIPADSINRGATIVVKGATNQVSHR